MSISQSRGAPKTLSVIVPIHNESETLRLAVERLLKVDIPLGLEVILVDDASSDGSLETIDDLVKDGVVKAFRHPSNKGKGAAIQTGLAAASGDLLTILDADLEYDPNDYPVLIKAVIEDSAKVVYGKRSFGAHTAYSFWYVLGNKFVALWASFLFNTWLSDIETCFKMAWRDTWLSLGLRQKGFGIEAEVTGKLLLRGYRIHEVPIGYRARSRQEGKKLDWKDGVQALWILLRVRLFRG